MKDRYTLTTVDPVFKVPSFTQTMSLEEAREFVHSKSVGEFHNFPWKWMIVNPKGFVVAAFDSLRMRGRER